MIILFFTGGGDAIGGSAAKEATYTQFKQYVDKGYVLSVVANKTESTLKIYINPKYTRDVYNMPGKVCRSQPIRQKYSSAPVDEVERYANQMLKERRYVPSATTTRRITTFGSTLFQSGTSALLPHPDVLEDSAAVWEAAVTWRRHLQRRQKAKLRCTKREMPSASPFKDVAGGRCKQEVKEIVDF